MHPLAHSQPPYTSRRGSSPQARSPINMSNPLDKPRFSFCSICYSFSSSANTWRKSQRLSPDKRGAEPSCCAIRGVSGEHGIGGLRGHRSTPRLRQEFHKGTHLTEHPIGAPTSVSHIRTRCNIEREETIIHNNAVQLHFDAGSRASVASRP